MDSWNKPYLYDYWDSRTGAIEVFSEAIRLTAEEEQKSYILDSIRNAIQVGIDKLSDKDLITMSAIMIDDLYKAANGTKIWDGALGKYIAASAGTFVEATARRGYLIHYLVDNTFEQSGAEGQRPLDLFPDWFRAAGFVYICPQLVRA